MKTGLAWKPHISPILVNPIRRFGSRKAITYGKLVNGVDACKYDKQWVVSIKAMKREYGKPKVG